MSQNPTPKWLVKKGFKIGFLNACHLLNKLSDVPSVLSNSDDCFHVFGFAESRFNDVVSDHLVSIPGYGFVRKDASCPNSKETGLIAYIHQSVNYKQLNIFDRHHIECIWIEVYLKGNKPMLIGMIYRNPSELADWFDRFELMIEDVLDYSSEVILLGDFNIDLLKPHSTWKRIIDTYNLTQLITSPTRVTSNTETLIDHIYVTNPSNIVETSVTNFGFSDHFPVCLNWCKKGVKIPRCNHKYIFYRSYKNFDPDLFLFDLSNTNFTDVYQHRDPDEALNSWYDAFLSVYNKHVPCNKKRIKLTENPPWPNEEITAAIKKREILLKTSGKDENFRKQRNKVNSLKRAAEKKYFS